MEFDVELPERQPSEKELTAGTELSIGEQRYQQRINFHITDDNLGAGGQKTKYGWNVAAIWLLRQLEKENRLVTSEEQEILSRYVGWGRYPSRHLMRSATYG